MAFEISVKTLVLILIFGAPVYVAMWCACAGGIIWTIDFFGSRKYDKKEKRRRDNINRIIRLDVWDRTSQEMILTTKTAVVPEAGALILTPEGNYRVINNSYALTGTDNSPEIPYTITVRAVVEPLIGKS
jgi:hypothetical protein